MKINKKKNQAHGVVSDGVTASGVVSDGYVQLNDDVFMSECWSRVQKQKDKSKCDTCDLRFKCYTEEWGKTYGKTYVGYHYEKPPIVAPVTEAVF